MKAYCAWCQREGTPGFMGEREPSDDSTATHGMCEHHMRQAIGPPPSTSFPDAHLLYVIRPAEVGLYEHLRRSLGALQDVRVIMERRGTERRRQVRQVSHERRRVERRWRREEVHHLGYAVVRFGAPAGARGSQQPGPSAVPPSVSPSG